MLILMAMNESLSINTNNLNGNSINDLIKTIQLLGSQFNIMIKFYDTHPGGPMIFLRHILLTGRYDFGISSIAMPWYMVVNDIYRQGDIFDILWNVYDNLWNLSSDTIIKNYNIGVFYTERQKSIAEMISEMFISYQIPYKLKIIYEPSQNIQTNLLFDRLLFEFSEHYEIIFICDNEDISNPGFCAKIGAASALGKPIYALLAQNLHEEDLNHLPISQQNRVRIDKKLKLEALITEIYKKFNQ
ncbi:MAG: hypothetical protein HQM03_09660 [Magnetococcales bacterium]|nr:hypothetical protein [Magnetococcales bacterium]